MKPAESSRIESATPTPETSSGIGLLLRLFWMFLGHLGLAVCGIKLMTGYPQNLVILTASVILLTALMISARYADIRYFNGETCDGDPATMAHFRTYALRMVLVAPAVYAGAIVLGLAVRN